MNMMYKVIDRTTGCSNMNCTYSTCKAAHAELIAAAPELLDAARLVLSNMKYADGIATGSTLDCEVLERALAKAGA